MKSSHLKLLLLEDHDDEAEELIEVLEAHDYQVKRAANSQEAETFVKNEIFDIMILDIMIDGSPDGLTFAQRIDRNKINIPFLFLTSINDKSIFERAKYTKTFNYLLKPFNEIELLFALELAIESNYSQLNTLSYGSDKGVLCPKFLFVKNNDCVKKIKVALINYIEVDEKYSSIYCNDKKYLIKLSLTKIKEILCDVNFVQIHRKFVVNSNKITELYLKDNLVILEDGTKLNFSERYKKIFLANNQIYSS